ncbi:hypothetical protein GCM10020256_41990 [Streptomyces thermocoprophilus]
MVVERVQAEDAEHGAHLGEAGDGGFLVVGGEGAVALPDGGVDDGERLGDAEVVVHGLGEGGRHLLGGVDGAGLLDDALDEAFDAGERGLGLAEGVLAVLDGGAVVRGAQVVAEHDGPPLLDHLGDEHAVAERLGHLLAAHGDPGVVHPVAGERVAEALGLGDLVLVVREDQVDAAAVDVELGAEVLVRHGGALQVPAGPAATPRGLPAGLARLGRLPHGEVAKVALAGLAVLGRLEEVLQLLVGQGEVAGQGAHVEVDVAVGLVGVAAFDEAAHHLDHLGHVPGGARLVGRGRQPSAVYASLKARSFS